MWQSFISYPIARYISSSISLSPLSALSTSRLDQSELSCVIPVCSQKHGWTSCLDYGPALLRRFYFVILYTVLFCTVLSSIACVGVSCILEFVYKILANHIVLPWTLALKLSTFMCECTVEYKNSFIYFYIWSLWTLGSYDPATKVRIRSIRSEP